MRDINSVILTGRLGKAPELKHTQSNTAVTSFSLAVSFDDKTDWIECVAWQKTAEIICQYYGKGDKVCVAGRLQTREYESGGVTRKVVEVNVNQIISFAQKKESGLADAYENKEIKYTEPDDEELPF